MHAYVGSKESIYRIPYVLGNIRELWRKIRVARNVHFPWFQGSEIAALKVPVQKIDGISDLQTVFLFQRSVKTTCKNVEVPWIISLPVKLWITCIAVPPLLMAHCILRPPLHRESLFKAKLTFRHLLPLLDKKPTIFNSFPERRQRLNFSYHLNSGIWLGSQGCTEWESAQCLYPYLKNAYRMGEISDLIGKDSFMRGPMDNTQPRISQKPTDLTTNDARTTPELKLWWQG